MRILCMIFKCKWVHVINVVTRDLARRVRLAPDGDGVTVAKPARMRSKMGGGLYQCSRCKSLSIGSPK